MLSPGLTISVTGVDSITKKKLKLYRRNSNVQLFFTDKPDLSRNICFLPAELLPEYFSSKRSNVCFNPPAVAFGPPEAMKLSIASGCIDYLCNPWSPEEFYARLCRCSPGVSFQYQGARFYSVDGELICMTDDQHRYALRLSKSETTIIKILSCNRGHFFSRQSLSEILSCGRNQDSRAVDMYISRLRTKIKELCHTAGIQADDSPVRTSSGKGWGIF